MITDYLTIDKCIISDDFVTFQIKNDITDINNNTFMSTVINIVNVIRCELKTYNDTNITTKPITGPGDIYDSNNIGKEKLTCLIKLNKIKKDNKHINKCKTYIHQSKSRGGNIISMFDNSCINTLNTLHAEMPCLKYGKNKNIDIKCMGKFLITFNVSVNISDITGQDEFTGTKIHIDIIANEVEIKYNATKCESILLKDIEEINSNKNNALQLLNI